MQRCAPHLVAVACVVQAACGPSTPSPEMRADECADFALTAGEGVVPPWPAERALPTTVEESVAALDEWLSERQRRHYLCTGLENALADAHFGLALWVRNEWLLDAAAPLPRELAELGLHSADSMSSLIVRRYLHQLHGQPLDVEAFIEQVREYESRVGAALEID